MFTMTRSSSNDTHRGGIPVVGLQPPDETHALIGELVHRFEAGDELGDHRVVDRRQQPRHVDLGKMESRHCPER